jgi:hypothetical protein
MKKLILICCGIVFLASHFALSATKTEEAQAKELNTIIEKFNREYKSKNLQFKLTDKWKGELKFIKTSANPRVTTLEFIPFGGVKVNGYLLQSFDQKTDADKIKYIQRVLQTKKSASIWSWFLSVAYAQGTDLDANAISSLATHWDQDESKWYKAGVDPSGKSTDFSKRETEALNEFGVLDANAIPKVTAVHVDCDANCSADPKATNPLGAGTCYKSEVQYDNGTSTTVYLSTDESSELESSGLLKADVTHDGHSYASISSVPTIKNPAPDNHTSFVTLAQATWKCCTTPSSASSNKNGVKADQSCIQHANKINSELGSTLGTSAGGTQ